MPIRLYQIRYGFEGNSIRSDGISISYFNFLNVLWTVVVCVCVCQDSGSDLSFIEGASPRERSPKEKKKKKKTKKPARPSRKPPGQSIYDVYEPSELAKSHLTDKDTVIRLTDVPER